MKNLILIRHGDNERDWNKGDTVSLTDKGREQIRTSISLSRDFIPCTGKTLILHSGLPRAQETASIIQDEFKDNALSINTKIDPEINERDVQRLMCVYIRLIAMVYMPEGNEPDSVIVVTHAHNPFSQIVTALLDPLVLDSSHSGLEGTCREAEIKELVDHVKSEEPIPLSHVAESLNGAAKDRNHPLRKSYGGTSIFRLDIYHWRQMIPGSGRLISAYSPI